MRDIVTVTCVFTSYEYNSVRKWSSHSAIFLIQTLVQGTHTNITCTAVREVAMQARNAAAASSNFRADASATKEFWHKKEGEICWPRHHAPLVCWRVKPTSISIQNDHHHGRQKPLSVWSDILERRALESRKSTNCRWARHDLIRLPNPSNMHPAPSCSSSLQRDSQEAHLFNPGVDSDCRTGVITPHTYM